MRVKRPKLAVLIPHRAATRSYRCYNCGGSIKRGEPYSHFMKVGKRCSHCGCARPVKRCFCTRCEPAGARYAKAMADRDAYLAERAAERQRFIDEEVERTIRFSSSKRPTTIRIEGSSCGVAPLRVRQAEKASVGLAPLAARERGAP